MSKRLSKVAFRLRPNKAVDRELFMSLLVRLAPSLKINNYHYIGLGGPFLEDFRVVHARLGINRMTCIDAEEEVHKRQLFNRPVESINCVCQTLEDYLDRAEFDTPVIIWFDYTEASSIASQIEQFARAFGAVPVRSVLRLTLNANPSSLGDPAAEELSVEVGGEVSDNRASKPTKAEYRFERLQKRLGALLPNGVTPECVTLKKYGPILLLAIRNAVENEALSHPDRRIAWAFSTHYADGQAMVTATLVVVPHEDEIIDGLVGGWEYCTAMDKPHCLDLPPLSALERLTMESKDDPSALINFEFPSGDLQDDAIAVFKRFYRIFPHFSRVEL